MRLKWTGLLLLLGITTMTWYAQTLRHDGISIQLQAGPAQAEDETALLERGRYLVVTGACNDCHHPSYGMRGGDVPVPDWLTGSNVGWRGPWGTTYPANLRLYVASMTEDQWVQKARALKTRPPMPYYVLNNLHESDLRGMYRFIRSLGPAGAMAPAYVPPGVDPTTPYIDFVPKEPRRHPATR